MANTVLTVGQNDAFFFLNSQGADGTGRPATGTVSVDNYSVAYVASPDGGHTIKVVPKSAGTVTVTVAGHSADGTPLPPVSRTYTVNPAPTPQATQFVLSTDNTEGIVNAPADPGSGSVPIATD